MRTWGPGSGFSRNIPLLYIIESSNRTSLPVPASENANAATTMIHHMMILDWGWTEPGFLRIQRSDLRPNLVSHSRGDLLVSVFENGCPLYDPWTIQWIIQDVMREIWWNLYFSFVSYKSCNYSRSPVIAEKEEGCFGQNTSAWN